MKYKKINPSNLTIKETYHLLISGVSPRPIALVSSIDNSGICNLAPFSFFNAFGANPPILGFSPALSGKTGMPKDTLLNIRETKEFSVSIVNSNIVEQVSLASCEYKRDIDEFEKAGLTKIDLDKISCPGVKESYFIMECRLVDIVELGNKPASGNLILGEVVMFHIGENVINDKNIIDPFELDAIARNGYSWYTENKKGLFKLKKPRNIGLGFDQLPNFILKSILTGNELSKLASIEEIPTYHCNSDFDDKNYDELISLIRLNLENNQIQNAWNIVLYLERKYD